MLTRSPPLPLSIDYSDEGGITVEDEEGILLAFEQCHRVRRLRHTFPCSEYTEPCDINQ
jgi:hypothetical protein